MRANLSNTVPFRPFPRHVAPAAVSLAIALLATPLTRADLGDSSYAVPLDHEAIRYNDTAPNDPVTELQTKLDAGGVKLAFDERTGYLKALLGALDVPVSSQGLVFSKTSFQLRRISPKNPRAIYFNDDVYIGWVRGGDVVEVSAADPKQGGMFYTLSQDPQAAPKFERTARCLQCHHSGRTAGVPGHLVRSVFTDDAGQPIGGTSTYLTDHRSPLIQRWGGWYVSGTHNGYLHMGNQTWPDAREADHADFTAGAHITDLSRFFNPDGYLSPHSDIAALMVLEHQTRMHNLLARVNYETRLALQHQKVMNEMLEQPEDTMLESTQRRFRNAAESLLKYMLFVGEAPLRGEVRGTSDFAKEFAARGPFDKKGRSLRQFDLNKRLFAYRCSYLIYSEAFDSLPAPMRDYVLRWLHDILTGKDDSETFQPVSAEQRQAILEILLDTKGNLPDYWRDGR